jgi:hypothetical protein
MVSSLCPLLFSIDNRPQQAKFLTLTEKTATRGARRPPHAVDVL